MLGQESKIEVVKIGMRCQSCGNIAKRECQHLRCRTCCRSLGLQCQTHVMNNWSSPAHKRRMEKEKQKQPIQDIPAKMQELNPQMQQQPLQVDIPDKMQELNPQQQQPLQVDMLDKMQKLNPSSGFEEENNFPEALSAIGIFRRIRLHSRDGAIDEEAYQASVNIGGHVFCGILYDQGPPNHQGIDAAAADNLVSNPQKQKPRKAAVKTSGGAIVASSSSASIAPAPAPALEQRACPDILNSFEVPVPSPPPF